MALIVKGGCCLLVNGHFWSTGNPGSSWCWLPQLLPNYYYNSKSIFEESLSTGNTFLATELVLIVTLPHLKHRTADRYVTYFPVIFASLLNEKEQMSKPISILAEGSLCDLLVCQEQAIFAPESQDLKGVPFID